MTPPDSVGKVYPDVDHAELGEHYTRHVSAMTSEGLHAKSEIAAQLAWRDAEIARLQALDRQRQEEVEDVRRHAGRFVLRAEAAEAALREAHTLPETWRNKWDGGCCCDAAGHECADALDAAIGGTGDA